MIELSYPTGKCVNHADREAHYLREYEKMVRVDCDEGYYGCSVYHQAKKVFIALLCVECYNKRDIN